MNISKANATVCLLYGITQYYSFRLDEIQP